LGTSKNIPGGNHSSYPCSISPRYLAAGGIEPLAAGTGQVDLCPAMGRGISRTGVEREQVTADERGSSWDAAAAGAIAAIPEQKIGAR